MENWSGLSAEFHREDENCNFCLATPSVRRKFPPVFLKPFGLKQALCRSVSMRLRMSCMCAQWPNDPSSATRRTGGNDGIHLRQGYGGQDRDAPAGFAAAYG